VTVIESRFSVWEALAGRAPGRPVAPADPGLWSAVAERLNPARARPVLRRGIEAVQLESVRGVAYVMLRSPEPPGGRGGGRTCYLRLTPEEWALARLMDGSRTVARLVAELARLSGRLAPDQVTRVVADLAGNRMLDELPVDAFRPLQRVRRRPLPVRLGRAALAFVRGRRIVVARVDPLVGLLYKAGGRLFFTRPVAVLVALVALAGLGLFGWSWVRGAQPVFLSGSSYASGALVLLGLNVVALGCHELGHALATKHAGRRVPIAGLLVYFGLPSVFVDTTDVWMAGRRARLVTTAAGPATGLFFAGVAQIVGAVEPSLAAWTFKLAFAWYINVAFNLNPFLALDGYYLLMDWLEVPNLRARGLAWVLARLRRRPLRFAALDREGRFVALYGMLSVVWLALAANIAYRVYVDRVDGLITGLWRAGWLQRVLLVAVVAGLGAPVVYVFAGWLGKRWRRIRDRLRERRVAADAPRRREVLLRSALSRLPGPALDQLAQAARWVRPRTGEQLVFAGAAQQSVYVVVDGALEARRPHDSPGTVRQRVGPGGVAGLAGALTGAASALSWYTAGTTLLAIPAPVVSGMAGPVGAPVSSGVGERAELEALFERAPALAALSTEDRLVLARQARPVTLAPGAPLVLTGPMDAAVVASGVLVVFDGTQRRAGQLVGPMGESRPGVASGVARTPARVWILPAVAGLPMLVRGGSPPAGSGPRHAPGFGVHPPSGYPPLAAPPGPPPSTSDDKDRRLERKMWWLLILLLLLALLFTGANLFAGPAWSEMPPDHALLLAQRGTLSAVVGGRPVTLHKGQKIYVTAGDRVTVADRSTARLTYRGGGYALLCAGSQVAVGPLASGGYPAAPVGLLTLTAGDLLADTTGTSSAFRPLGLTVASGGTQVANADAARFMVGGSGLDVSVGQVVRDGVAQQPTNDVLSCGDGESLPPPAEPPSPSAQPSESPSPMPSLSPSLSSSASPSASTATPSRSPRSSPSPRRSTSPPPSPPPPPPDQPPAVVRGPTAGNPGIYAAGAAGFCTPKSTLITTYVSDPDNTSSQVKARGTWSVNGSSGSFTVSYVTDQAAGLWVYQGTLGPLDVVADNDAPISVTITVTDGRKSASGSTTVTLFTICIG
jgi:putative peptide zinc metalloprotease protein